MMMAGPPQQISTAKSPRQVVASLVSCLVVAALLWRYATYHLMMAFAGVFVFAKMFVFTRQALKNASWRAEDVAEEKARIVAEAECDSRIRRTASSPSLGDPSPTGSQTFKSAFSEPTFSIEQVKVSVDMKKCVADEGGSWFWAFGLKVEYDGNSHAILKRYSDFEALHAKLSKSVLGCPVLPPKRMLFRQTKQFAETRRLELDVWMRMLFARPKLRDHVAVQTFIW